MSNMSDIIDNKGLIPIVKRNGITISGRIIGPGTRLGQFEVRSTTDKGGPYALLSEAEDKMHAIEYILLQQQIRANGSDPKQLSKISLRPSKNQVFNRR